MLVRNIETLPVPLKDAFIIKASEFRDERGSFYKMYNEDALIANGVKPYFSEEYISVSKKNVLRGLHYQEGEHAQAKLIMCTRGEVYDVIVDLRIPSPTYAKWFGTKLTEMERNALYAPRGFAHGFIALTDYAEVHYMADNRYAPETECGLIWNDAKLNIQWPCNEPILSQKDRKWPSFRDCKKFK